MAIMGPDFTVRKYVELCNAIISSGYTPITMGRYFSGDVPRRFVLMRHDVDTGPLNAVTIAGVEGEMGIRASYYFRPNRSTFRSGAIQKVRSLGHEVGYHYEVLSKCHGDYQKAIDLFGRELVRLRALADVRTICMHGVPLSPFVNSNIWKVYDFKDYGIVGDAYLSMGRDFYYFSDSGRSWDSRIKVKDTLPSLSASVSISGTDGLIKLIKKGDIDRLYILSHPDVWVDGRLAWASIWLRESIFNAGKRVIKAVRSP
jgi:hypothetical protein